MLGSVCLIQTWGVVTPRTSIFYIRCPCASCYPAKSIRALKESVGFSCWLIYVLTRKLMPVVMCCSLKVNSILRHVAALLNYETDSELEDLYMKTAWMFDRKYGKPGASYDAFKHAVTLVNFVGIFGIFIYKHTHTQPFNDLLSGTTGVGRYQKKHSPTHTHPDHRTSFIIFLHLQRSMASCMFSLRA